MSLGRVLKRVLVYCLCGAAFVVLMGCILRPTWWYFFIWQGGLTHGYNYTAFLTEAHRTPLRAAIGVVCLAFIVLPLYLDRRAVNAFVDRYGGITAIMAVLAATAGVLLVNATERKGKAWELIVLSRQVAELPRPLMNLLTDGLRAPLDPPIRFYFIDEPVLASLFAQIEPDFIERSKTESERRKGGGKLSIGVGSSGASAELGSELDATREFERVASSPERRARQLIRYCLQTGRAAFLRDRPIMVIDILLPQLQRRLDMARAGLDDPIKPLTDEEIRRHQQRKDEKGSASLLESAEQKVDSILAAPPDFVLLDVPQSAGVVNGSTREYRASLATASQPMVVSVLVPASVELPSPRTPGTTAVLHVFGHVTERSSGISPRLTIRAIAIF